MKRKDNQQALSKASVMLKSANALERQHYSNALSSKTKALERDERCKVSVKKPGFRKTRIVRSKHYDKQDRNVT